MMEEKRGDPMYNSTFGRGFLIEFPILGINSRDFLREIKREIKALKLLEIKIIQASNAM
jgi:hypothetical protein